MRKRAIAKTLLVVSSVAALAAFGTAETVEAHGGGHMRSQAVQNQMGPHHNEHVQGYAPEQAEEQQDWWENHHSEMHEGMHAHAYGNGGRMMGGHGWGMHSGHGYMHGQDDAHQHDQSGTLPEGIQPAKSPAYASGEAVILLHGHMQGMEGAEATVVGAFNTVAYEVTYYPTHGGEPEYNHRWVVHEEIRDAGTEVLEVGDEVSLEAHHMPGMYGATAVIEAVEETTVYMVDYQPTDGGSIVRNHKWVTEAELTPVE